MGAAELQTGEQRGFSEEAMSHSQPQPARQPSWLLTRILLAILCLFLGWAWTTRSPRPTPTSISQVTPALRDALSNGMLTALALEEDSGWLQPLKRRFFLAPAELRACVVELISGVAADRTGEGELSEPSRSTARLYLAVVAAEAQLSGLPLQGLDVAALPLPDDLRGRAVRLAYTDRTKPAEAGDFPAEEPLLDDAWADTIVRMRLAEKKGDPHSAELLRGDLLRRGERLVDGALRRSVIRWALVALGVVCALAGVVRGRTPIARVPDSTGWSWSAELGLGIAIRTLIAPFAFGALAFFPGLLVLVFEMGLSPTVEFFLIADMVVGAVILMLLVWRYSPETSLPALLNATGLRISRATAVPYLASALVLLAIVELGGETIRQLALSLSASSGCGWTPGSGAAAGGWMGAFLFANRILLKPLFEEVVFRGILYRALRKKIRPLPAAIASAALFSIMHVQAWPETLSIFWIGLVLCFGFERCRSVIPLVICHGLYNL